MLQQAAFHNMPIAFASANSVELYEQINRDLKSLTLWWTPDTTFSDPQPSLVIMPPHDAAEWRQGIYKTGLRAQPLQKWASFAFSRVASRANSLVQNVDIVESDMQELISMYLSGSHSRYEAACEWIRLHSNRWEAWVPAKTECNVGEGLVDSNGDFVSSKVSADECGTCPPGRASEKLANTFRCSSCQVLGLGPLGFRVQGLDKFRGLGFRGLIIEGLGVFGFGVPAVRWGSIRTPLGHLLVSDVTLEASQQPQAQLSVSCADSVSSPMPVV